MVTQRRVVSNQGTSTGQPWCLCVPYVLPGLLSNGVGTISPPYVPPANSGLVAMFMHVGVVETNGTDLIVTPTIIQQGNPVVLSQVFTLTAGDAQTVPTIFDPPLVIFNRTTAYWDQLVVEITQVGAVASNLTLQVWFG
jgi:hypothetical protein